MASLKNLKNLKNMTMLLLALLIVAAPLQASICELACPICARPAVSPLAAPTQSEAMPMHSGHCSGAVGSSAARKSLNARTAKVCAAVGCEHMASVFDASAHVSNRATAIPLFFSEALPSARTLPGNSSPTGHNPSRLAAPRSPLLLSLRI